MWELVEHVCVIFSDTIIHSLHPHVDTQLYLINKISMILL